LALPTTNQERKAVDLCCGIGKDAFRSIKFIAPNTYKTFVSCQLMGSLWDRKKLITISE